MNATESARAGSHTRDRIPEWNGRMCLRYGMNLGDRWSDLAFSPCRANLVERIREAGTAVVRVFVDPMANPPAAQWQEYAAFFDAVLESRSTPMIALCCPAAWGDHDT